MPSITFLSGFKPFRKHFAVDNTTAYPLIKTVTSHTFQYDITDDGLRYKTQLLKEAADNGACLLKGPLTKELAKESRAGHSDKNAPTQSIMLDFDGLVISDVKITPPLDRSDLEHIADRLVQELPVAFHDVSYIVHASASLGLKGHQIRMHLDFATQEQINPQTLKSLLTWLNIESKLFLNNTELTATGKALKFPIDRCLADNSRLIFIGHPSFDGVVDPIPNKDNRIFMVKRSKVAVELAETLEQMDLAKCEREIRKRINTLRAAAGWPESREKTQRIKFGDDYINLVVNPEQSTMSFHQDHGSYVTYNINGGDSHGYYVRKENPNIVWNFKGEPPFLFSQADPDTYNWHLENFGNEATATAQEPFVFRDIESNTYYNGFYNPGTKHITFLRPADRASLQSFMVENGGVMPEHPPQWRIVFEPNNPIELNRRDGIVNLWQEPELLCSDIEIPEPIYGAASTEIEKMCPYIHQTLNSVLGCDEDSYNHFINWLAFIFQTRQKANTAWLLHGIEGTGKGVLASRILKPMLESPNMSRTYYHTMRVENIKEQFNEWMEHTLIAFVDEFKAPGTVAGDELVDKLKNYITEAFSPVRRMRKGQELAKNILNLIFATNSYDPMEPSESDRRFNVAPRQEIPIERRYPGYRDAIYRGEIERELPIFAKYIMSYPFNAKQAMTAMDNEAKRILRNQSIDTTGNFINAVRFGNLPYFLEVMEVFCIGRTEEYKYAAMNHCRAWIQDAMEGKPSLVYTRELKPAYNVLVTNQDSDDKFAKTFARRGYPSKHIRRGGMLGKGFEITWRIEPDDLKIIADRYIAKDKFDLNKVLDDETLNSRPGHDGQNTEPVSQTTPERSGTVTDGTDSVQTVD